MTELTYIVLTETSETSAHANRETLLLANDIVSAWQSATGCTHLVTKGGVKVVVQSPGEIYSRIARSDAKIKDDTLYKK